MWLWPWWIRCWLAAFAASLVAAQRSKTQEGPADCDAVARQNAVENFDFSRASFAQPVAEGDDFEDAFYPDVGSYKDLPENSEAAGNGDVAPGPNESCCRLESDAALRLCANKTSPLVNAGDPPLALVVSHAPKKLRNGALTGAINAMWCAEQGYPFVLDQRNVEPASTKSQVIPHWLETCQREGIKWMLWLDSDTILVGQHASLDFVADVAGKFNGSDAQIILTSVQNSSDRQQPSSAAAASLGIIFLRCSDWTRSLMERVGNESLDQGILDDEALREVFLSGDLEEKRQFIQLPPQATNPASLLSPMAEPQPVLQLAELPASIQNHTFSAALRARCDQPMLGMAWNSSLVQYAYENSLFLAASKDFREAGTSRYAFLLAKRLKEQGRTQEAEDLLRWAVDGLHAELGEHKIDTLFGKVVLAKFLADQDRVAEARPLLQDAVTAGLKSLGAHNPVMLDWQERLVALLRQEGLHQEAAGVLRQVIRGRRRWREEAKVKAAALQLHKILLLGSANAPSPEQLIEEIMSSFPDAADSIARQRLIKANEKSSKLSGEGNLNQAEWVLKRALEKSTLVLPVADPDLLVSRLNLGALRQRMSKPEALLDLEEVFQAQVSMMGPDHPDTQATIQAINGLEGWEGQYNLHARYQGALSKLASANNRFAKRTKATQRNSDRTAPWHVLESPAFECFRERDPSDFRNPRGVLQLLSILDDRFQFSPEQDLSDRLEELFFRLRRRRGEETTSFSTRLETLMAKTEALITEEQRAERKKQQDLQRAEYRRQSLDYIVSKQEHDALIATLADGADRPEAPRPPAPPPDLPTIQPFTFPETMKGFLFLRHIGISLQTRSSLLRSSGGSLRYDKVSDLLRRTELDALVAARAQPHGQGHGFMADAATEDNDDDDDGDWFDEDEFEDDDFGGYVEDEESEDSLEDEQEDGAVDDEYDTAMVGYLEARRKFMDLRRARGFQEPEQSSSTAKGASKHRDRDRRDDRREGRGKPTGPSRRPDFSWRERDRRMPGQQQRGRRPATPPPTRKKGTGKSRSKGKGSRAGSSSRRGEPAGAQYLGMAVNAATSSSTMASPHDFVPEFSFVAFSTSVPPPPGLDTSPISSAGARQCGFVSRLALSSVEQFAEECLALDRSLGLVCPEQGEEQACCLVTPPGYAILDTGCTSTLVGSENERLWRAELERKTHGELQPELSQSDVRFEGINGETRASYQVRYPVRIGHRDGYVKAAVIPGRAPFLLSIQALRAMGAKLDCAADTLTVPGMGEVKLELNSVGHYMIPLLDFPGERSPSDHVPDDHALASAEAGFGPESELVVNTPFPRPEGVDEPPGLKVERDDNASSPDQSVSVEPLVPKYQSVATRAEKYAIGAFLRPRETKGPLVALPRELPTVHLILGKHGFDVQHRQAWRVRAAQIGYRAKVIRRPPPQGWVTVLSLDDQSSRVAVDWTRCEDCVGHQLPDQRGDFVRWLFVFALPPVTPELTSVVYAAVQVGGSETCVGPLKISLVVSLTRAPSTHHIPQTMPCKCLSGPDSEQMPQYAHCGHHFIESFGNATGTTWHCTVCRAKCRECKGRVARWIKSTNKIEYSHRKDCAVTPVPGPSGVTLLADGDLVRVSDADATIDKFGKVPYPFNVRQVALWTERLTALKEAENGRTDIPPGPFSSTSQKETNQEIKQIKGTVSAGRMTVGTTGMAAPSEGPMGYPAVQRRPPVEPKVIDEVAKVQQTVRDMLAREYQTFPTSTTSDVPMTAGKSIPDQVKDLEEQAAALIAQAALLRQQHGLPASSLFPPTRHPQMPDPCNRLGAVHYDPDADSTWERLQLR
eukprot:s4218_g2.t2